MAILKKYLVWAWMVALFTATVGVSVQQIYCYCLNKTTISWFASNEACHVKEKKETTVASCCRKKQASCCEKRVQKEHSSKPCTKKTTRVFQLKTEFVLEKQIEKQEKSPIEDLRVVEIPDFFYLNAPKDVDIVQPPPTPPPPLSGRSICLLHQHFRC
ncbi:MAG: hypothetical protein WCR52_18665 [Bacteroidota bacterium]